MTHPFMPKLDSLPEMKEGRFKLYRRYDLSDDDYFRLYLWVHKVYWEFDDIKTILDVLFRDCDKENRMMIFLLIQVMISRDAKEQIFFDIDEKT